MAVHLTEDNPEVLQVTGEIFATESLWFRFPLCPDLSIGAMTNGMSLDFQRSIPLMISGKKKKILFNSMILQYFSSLFFEKHIITGFLLF